MTRTVRLPFSHGQRVSHPDWPEMEFVVLYETVDAEDRWTIAVTDLSGGGFWSFPAEQLSAEHDTHQQALARWMGCSVDTMNSEHDGMHEYLCDWLGIESRSLRVARGEKLSDEDFALSCMEEDVVLHLQRLVAHLPKLAK